MYVLQSISVSVTTVSARCYMHSEPRGCHVVGVNEEDEQGIFSIITPESAASATNSSGVIHRVWSGLYARSFARASSDIVVSSMRVRLMGFTLML
jgi:hypothetical protein